MDRFEGLSVQPIDDRTSLHWEMVSCSEVACGETPLAARPPASGRWHRGMNLQEFSAEPTPQRVHPNTGTIGGVDLAPLTPQGCLDLESVRAQAGR